ncbi:MAG TPA: HTH domain-containing protein [Polyangiales bacterium]|nr:HTH domain-containing protein [Polyangiales bacterium]
MDAERRAAEALAQGDALRALSAIGVDDGPGARLLRGIAYAQLGDLELARDTLGALTHASVAARARAALVEIELRVGEPSKALRLAQASADELSTHDARNAALQRLNIARAEVLLGRLADARHTLAALTELPADLHATWWLARAEVAVRAGAAKEAASALAQVRAPHALLERECAALERELSLPIARITRGDHTTDADLHAIEAVADGSVFLVDACRLRAVAGRVTLPLARRPVLFALLRELASGALPRDTLIQRAFAVRHVNDSHRARLRVEVGRLRAELLDLDVHPEATKDGYALRSTRDVVLLTPRSDDDSTRLAMLLGDGATWTAQSLAEHAGISKRTVQRALSALVDSGQVERLGSGRDVRYLRPGTPLASRLLLLGLLPE